MRQETDLHPPLMHLENSRIDTAIMQLPPDGVSEAQMSEPYLDDLEECLDIILPESYRRSLRQLRRRKRLSNGLDQSVLRSAEELRAINEEARISKRVAGHREWPEHLFVIGLDDCGNYYAIHHDEEDSPVVIYDRQQDELRQVAPSLDVFCKRVGKGLALDHKLLSKGRSRKRPAVKVVVPDLSRQPKWTRCWSSFVETFAAMPERDGKNDAEISKVNARFGSRAVRWEGLVQNVDLGTDARVLIEMPQVPALSQLPELEQLNIALRWTSENRPVGVWRPRDGSPQILSAMSDWRQVQRGQRIEFLMMLAPGLNRMFGCVGPTRVGEVRYLISALGAHVLRIVED